ncbi:TadE/TadG family type IV pilus assembly protein [Oceanirhabdus sp. W0125-5]|uniref:TadE/TadG family type IV pilus assembly protein n=1 Tax=Oceanirhabdus sp. W0125-5 TaxID=2999116 RepID=UPI0022F331AC|nr:TadE/TadG family type IV pilus assembly protein [Oceanirhabdus sp. W0125-5]WBW95959.1 TadE/TadG family type IV pilus assembly protein [Oceanirhabdus sp. W0125-5]
MNIVKKLIKDERGQSLSEFVVVLPLVLFVIFGVLTLGVMIYVKMLVVLSSSQAARVGAEVMNDSTYTVEEKMEKIESTALTFLTNGMTGKERDVDINVEEDLIKVNVTYDFKLILPFLGDIFKDKLKIPIHYESVYMIE